jgi:hypothetical protein
MTQTRSLSETGFVDVPGRRRAWPLTATAAGLCGVAATLVLDGRGTDDGRLFVHLAVVMLLVTAAQWRRRVEPRVPGSTATRLLPLGLVTAAAGLTFGHDWLGVVVAAGAVAWMALRERTVSRWIGVVSVLPVLHTTLVVVGTGVPELGALLGPLWLVVTGVGLALGRSTIVR